MLNIEYEMFVNYDVSFSSTLLAADVHLFRKRSISGLIVEEALIKVFDKYIDFVNLFLPYLASKLPNHIIIKNYTIKLVNG